MMPYILHVAILIVLCYLVYKILLSKETFYRLNRYVLLAGMIFSLSLPLVSIPESWSLRPLLSWDRLSLSLTPVAEATGEETSALESTIDSKTEIKPGSDAKLEPSQKSEKVAPPVQAKSQWNWSALIYYIYWIATGIFLLNILIQLFTLGIQVLRNPRVRDGKYLIVELDNDNAPYSFLNIIFINPEKYDWETYQQILSHEKVHVHQVHSLDLLLAEILIAFQWFNPIAWLYRKALENNLEYLTDASMLSQGTSRESYQMNLLKVSVPHYPMQITTNYNQSFLKRRIAMMNTKKSSVSSVWKYLFLLPLLGLSMMSLNQVQLAPPQVVAEINKLVKPQKQVKPNPDVPDAGQKNAQSDASLARESNEKPFSIQIEAWKFGDIKGIWRGDIHGEQLCIAFDHSDRDKGRIWMNTKCFDRNAFGTLPINQEGTFSLTREAGTISLTGKFEEEEGYGKFEFSPNEDFKRFLNKEGVQKSDDYLLFLCFFSEMGKEDIRYAKTKFPRISSKELRKIAIHGLNKSKMESYTNYLAKNGFAKPDIEMLIKLEIHEVTPEYVESMKKAGYKEKSIESYVKARIHDVGPDYGRQFTELGYKDLSLRELIKFSIHDVNAEFIKEMKTLGFGNLSEEELVKASIHDIDTDFVKEMQALGFRNLSLSQLIKASIHDVNTDLVKELKSIGYSDLSLEEIMKASIHDVDANFARELSNLGYKNLSLEQLVKASIHDVDARFVKELKGLGFDNLSLEDMIKASIHDVDARLVKSFKDLGYNNLSMEQLVKLSIHDVDGRFVNGLAALGFKNISVEDLVEARIHDVTPEYIRQLNEKGIKDLSLEEYRRMKIHGLDKALLKKKD